MNTLEELRLIEDFLDQSATRGDDPAEMRRNVSARILGLELNEIYQDREFCISTALEFYKREETK